MKKAIIIFTIALVLVLTVVFYIPGSKEKLSLDKDFFLDGEYWRIFSYPFAHESLEHLLQNVLGLFLAAFIALELNVDFKNYSLTYFSSAILAILPLWLFLSFVALGSSAAVYGLFGYVAKDTSKFEMNFNYIFIATLLVIFGTAIYSVYLGGFWKSSLLQALAHLSGFLFGITIYYGTHKYEDHLLSRKKYLLRGESRE